MLVAAGARAGVKVEHALRMLDCAIKVYAPLTLDEFFLLMTERVRARNELIRRKCSEVVWRIRQAQQGCTCQPDAFRQ